MKAPYDKSALAASVRGGTTLWAAGAFDALSARLCQEAGFEAIMSTGFGVSASHLGQPDMEMYTMTENLGVVRNMVSSTTIPLVADTDTGYGNALNVMRTVREFERAGVFGMIFEDQENPKRCPAAAKRIDVIPRVEAAGKIRAAVDARTDPDTLIIARTDATDVSDAIERAASYAEAGADLIQPISRCFTNFDDLKRLREGCGLPLSLQVLGWLETDLEPEQIEEVAGLAVFPLVALMSATAAMRENLARLKGDHTTKHLPRSVTSMADFKEMIGFAELEHSQSRYLIDPKAASFD